MILNYSAMNPLNELIFAFKCAIIAYVYANVLTDRGQLLSGLWLWLDQRIGKYPFIFNPLIGCFKCVSGQVALWWYLYGVFSKLEYAFNPFEWVYVICLTIFISLILNFIYDRVKNS